MKIPDETAAVVGPFAPSVPGWDPMPASLSLYVDEAKDVDATYERALELGAISERKPENTFYGYRVAGVRDVGGNKWSICAVVEQLTREEMQKRAEKMMGG